MEQSNPPKWAWNFLRLFCKQEYLDDIEGDLLQFYDRRVVEMGKSKADLQFIKDVFFLFRPGVIRSFFYTQNLKFSQMDILIHSLKVSVRNFNKYRGSFFINLLGLSTGLACVIFIFLWVQDELKIDQFHSKNDRLYQLLENVEQGGGMITRTTTAGPTSPALQ